MTKTLLLALLLALLWLAAGCKPVPVVKTPVIAQPQPNPPVPVRSASMVARPAVAVVQHPPVHYDGVAICLIPWTTNLTRFELLAGPTVTGPWGPPLSSVVLDGPVHPYWFLVTDGTNFEQRYFTVRTNSL